jgi:hypothetical protein
MSFDTRVFLRQHFQNRWTERRVSVAWPPKSPDLTPLDYYVWICKKSLVYALKSTTRVELSNRITDSTVHIRYDSLLRYISSTSRRTTICIDKERGNFKHLLH